MKNYLLISAFTLLVLAAQAQQSFGPLMFSAKLDTTQEGSLAVLSSGRGMAGFTFENDTLWFDITANGLTGPITAAHIHAESNHSVVYSLVPFINRNEIKGYIPGISFADGSLKPFLEGEFYVNIHTSANPGGEISGRILPETDINYLAKLDMAQAGNTNPPDKMPIGLGTFNLSQDNTMLEVNVLVNDLTSPITNAHLHYGMPGVSGPVIVPISQFRTGNSYRGVFDLTTLADPAAFLDSLQMGEVYVNIHTSNYPAGEIRGQLYKNRTLSFDTWLNSGSETGTIDPTTPASAMGLCNLAVSSMMDTLWVNMVADSLSGAITGTHFHTGLPGVAGPVVVSLTGFVNGNDISGYVLPGGPQFTTSLDFSHFVTDAIEGGIYVNIHTALNPAGEVRGQVSGVARKGVIYTMCAAQETGTIIGATADQGSGFVTLDRNHTNLHYGMAVSNLTTTLTGDHFHHALPGVSGPVIFSLPPDTVIMGYWKTDFTTDIADMFVNGEIYANFHTSVNPGGEIRGQVATGDWCSPKTGITDITPAVDNSVLIFPNPLKNNADIRYTLGTQGKVEFKMYNLLGTEVSNLTEGNRLPGTYDLVYDASALPGGIYFYRLLLNSKLVNTGKFIVTR
jgi:hypothetical protein